MRIKIYNIENEIEEVHKDIGNHVQELDGDPIESISRLHTSIKLPLNNESLKGNYVYIEDYGRYYYIIDLIWQYDNVFELVLKCDVLKSWEEGIDNSKAIIDKQEEKHINKFYNDGTFVSEDRSVVKLEKFPYNFTGNDLAYILTTI